MTGSMLRPIAAAGVVMLALVIFAVPNYASTQPQAVAATLVLMLVFAALAVRAMVTNA